MGTQRWPTYEFGDPSEGPGCGQNAHANDCLCDIVLTPGPTHTYVGRYAYRSTAELALRRKGIDDPSALEVFCQMLALRDVLSSYAAAAEKIVEAEIEVSDCFDDTSVGYSRQTAAKGLNIGRRRAMRTAIAASWRAAPLMAGMPLDEMISVGWCVTPEALVKLRASALAAPNHTAWERAVNGTELAEGVLFSAESKALYCALVGDAHGEKTARGSLAGSADQIMALLASGSFLKGDIARAFGVTPGAISRLIARSRKSDLVAA